MGAEEEFGESVLELQRTWGLDAAAHYSGGIAFTLKEHEILRELPRHQSISDIAAKQRLSPNTIKTHLRSIYQKLAVNGRSEAVDRALELGLL